MNTHFRTIKYYWRPEIAVKGRVTKLVGKKLAKVSVSTTQYVLFSFFFSASLILSLSWLKPANFLFNKVFFFILERKKIPSPNKLS